MKLKKKLLLGCVTIGMLMLVACDKQGKSLEDGTYSCDLTMTGGTGKASIESPVEVEVKDGVAYATLIWSSKNYDYMIVNEEKYMNEAEADSPSLFTVPIDMPPCEMVVIGDTTAMSKPHEVEYTLNFEVKE